MKKNRFLRLSTTKTSITILTIILILLTSACAKDYYYNGNYLNTQQTQYFNRDSAECNVMSSSAAPQQQVTLNSRPSSTTYGNIYAEGSDNSQYAGSYSSRTSYENTANQMADMANAMNSIGTSMRRTNVYWQCMTGKGWYKIKGKELTPEERIFFGVTPKVDGPPRFYFNKNYPENQQQPFFKQDTIQCYSEFPDPKTTDGFWICMKKRGWLQTKGKILTPKERNDFGLSPATPQRSDY